MQTIYRPGRWQTLVAPGALVALPEDAPQELVVALWERLSAERTLAVVVDAVTDSVGGSFASMPPFVAAVLEGANARVAVRGDVGLEVTGADGVETLSGHNVMTWSERFIPGVGRIVLHLHDPAGAPELPLLGGVVGASEVVADIEPGDGSALDAQPVAEPVGVPADAPVAEPPAPSEADAPAEPAEADAAAVAAFSVAAGFGVAAGFPTPPPPPVAPAAPVIEASADDEAPAEPATDETDGTEDPAEEVQLTDADGADVPADADEDAPAGIVEDEPADETPEPAVEPSTDPAPGSEPEQAPVTDPEVASAPVADPEPTAPADDSVDDRTLIPAEHTLAADDFDEFQQLFGDTVHLAPSTAPAPPELAGDHDGATISVAEARALRNDLPPVPQLEPEAPTALLPTVGGGRIRVSTGQVVALDRTIVIGRRPRSPRASGASLPHLIAVESPQQDISRSHLEIRPEGDTVVVIDLHTTNGSTLLRPGADPVRLHPGEQTLVLSGDVIDLGDGVTVAFEDLP